MKLNKIALILMFVFLLTSCSDSRFDFDLGINKNHIIKIAFLDVGHGDAAILECDGHYMMIDCGSRDKSKKIIDFINDNKIKKFDIIALSHLHEDHIGGLKKILQNDLRVDSIIANSKDCKSSICKFNFEDYESSILVPKKGDKFSLGHAEIEVISNNHDKHNDSLVLMITLDDVRFLFTGDIESNGQRDVANYFEYTESAKYINLIKVPHHGSFQQGYGYTDNYLNTLFQRYNPSYFVISAGEKFGHPHKQTIDLIYNVLDVKGIDKKDHLFITKELGDIYLKSNGKGIIKIDMWD